VSLEGGNGSDPDISCDLSSLDVVLTRAETRRLIAAIEELGQANLRLISESRGVRKLVTVVILMTATFLGGFAVALWHQRTLNADLKVHAELQQETTDRLVVLLEGVCVDPQRERGREPARNARVLHSGSCPGEEQRRRDPPLRLMIDRPPTKDASVD
jgi:hypothetical protein